MSKLGRAIVAQSPDETHFVLDRDLFDGDWSFFGRYALVLSTGQSIASSDSLEALKIWEQR